MSRMKYRNSIVFTIIFKILIAKHLLLKCVTAIIGGEIAHHGQFTYQVSLYFGIEHLCGGGIISDQHILTAAHCVISSKNRNFRQTPLVAVIDTATLTSLDLCEGIQVQKAYALRNYNPVNVDHSEADIAVLKLEKPIGLTNLPHITKLKIPEPPYSSYEEKWATIAGFGWSWIKVTEDPHSLKDLEEGGSDGKLRHAPSLIIPDEVCDEMASTHVYKGDFCAIMQQEDEDRPQGVCTGDSGGPLVYKHAYVIGVLSYSPLGCREDSEAAIYARVTHFAEFIRNAIDDVVTPQMRSVTYKS